MTLHHPHGQIYAYPFVPARTQSLLTEARRHHDRTGKLLGADILAAERADGSRMVLEGEHWSAYVPYAARWPVEVHLAPHRDVPDLVALTGEERDELAEQVLGVDAHAGHRRPVAAGDEADPHRSTARSVASARGTISWARWLSRDSSRVTSRS